MKKRPSLRINADEIEEDLLFEVLELTQEVGLQAERTELGNILEHLDLLRSIESEKARRKGILDRINAAESEVQAIAMSLAHSRLWAQERRAQEKGKERHLRIKEPMAAPIISTHELKSALADLRNLVKKKSIGFYRDIEQHFKDKRMVNAFQSFLEGNLDQTDQEDLIRQYMGIPSGVEKAEAVKTVELWFLSKFLGKKPGAPLPGYYIRLYNLMRKSRKHEVKLASYILMRQSAEHKGFEQIRPDLMSASPLEKMEKHKVCMLLSMISDYPEWINGIKTLLKVDEVAAKEVIGDIIRYCNGEATEKLESVSVLGGEGTVVRLDLGQDNVIFFRFGDARSHALGYFLLKKYGFPTPESHELHESMCNLEAQVRGHAYGEAHNIPKRTAYSLGRLLAACFIFGIPDPNETNFIIRGQEVVKIDAESSPYGWNYYSGDFIGGVSRSRPNDSYRFSIVLDIHPGTKNSIRAGFIEGLYQLRDAFSRPDEAKALCDIIRREYSGAHIYRTAGKGIDEKVIDRLRARLEALGKRTSEDLLNKAERGEEIR